MYCDCTLYQNIALYATVLPRVSLHPSFLPPRNCDSWHLRPSLLTPSPSPPFSSTYPQPFTLRGLRISSRPSTDIVTSLRPVSRTPPRPPSSLPAAPLPCNPTITRPAPMAALARRQPPYPPHSRNGSTHAGDIVKTESGKHAPNERVGGAREEDYGGSRGGGGWNRGGGLRKTVDEVKTRERRAEDVGCKEVPQKTWGDAKAGTMGGPR